MGETRGFGVAGEYPQETIHVAARAAAHAGFRSFWLSQPPERDSLVTLAEVARLTETIELGIGAIPLTLRPAQGIAEAVVQLELPLARLRLGIGSGTEPGALDRVRQGVLLLKEQLDVHVAVAPLGPKMCRVAGEVADSVLLNWLVPAFARTSIEWVRAGAQAAGRRPPPVCTYVRCALGQASLPRLRQECDRYGSFPHYAAHFRRQGVEPLAATIFVESQDEL
ncbi:MAG TPA: LLM class flavin-dependent oxidoreductase, partial [Thermomicrobiaceae bacterium]|nr:LLM class flavin-dependent oxidoreductase [Thermomicrobiaceae bacterium]